MSSHVNNEENELEKEGFKRNYWIWGVIIFVWIMIIVGLLFRIDPVSIGICVALDVACVMLLVMAIKADKEGRPYWYFGIHFRDTVCLSPSVKRRYTRCQVNVISALSMIYFIYSIFAIVKKYDFSADFFVWFILFIIGFIISIKTKFLLDGVTPKKETKENNKTEVVEDENN